MKEKSKKMTLKGYFAFLSSQKTPLQEFIGEVMKKTGRSSQTVRNWGLYGIKPRSYADVKVLVEMTGIKEEDLWQD